MHYQFFEKGSDVVMPFSSSFEECVVSHFVQLEGICSFLFVIVIVIVVEQRKE